MNSKQKDILSLIIKVAVILTVFIITLINYNKLTNIDIRQIVSSSSDKTIAVLSILLIYLIKGIVFVIPASLIYISVGLAFDPITAVIINLGGILIEVIISYLFGIFLGGKYVEKLLLKNEKSAKLLKLKENDKHSSVFYVRLLPVFPIDFTSLFLGSIKYPFLKYTLLSLIGLAPHVVVLTILGDKIYDYIPMQLIIKIIICLIPVCAVALVIRWLVKRKKAKSNTQ